MTVREALCLHMKRYVKMTPQDAVKLLYQSEFGGGHMIRDREGARLFLLRELEKTPRSGTVPTVEALGPDAARINLASLPDGLSPDTLFSVFLGSTELFSGSEERFAQKLMLPRELIEENIAPFSLGEYDAYVGRYLREGGGAVHHSPAYAAAYRPAYRVVHSSFASALPVFAAVDSLLMRGERGYAVLIDGRCGAGKTTLAERLASVYGCGTVHLDDYYLPFRMRSDQLGFIDADRLAHELSAAGGSFVSRAYDPHTDKFTHERNVERSPFFVVEGSYSFGTVSNIGLSCKLSVFMTVESGERLRRLSERSPDSVDAFINRWIPAEEEYFARSRAESSADIVVET